MRNGVLKAYFLYTISLRRGGYILEDRIWTNILIRWFILEYVLIYLLDGLFVEYVLIYLLDGLFVEKINNIYLRLLLYLFSGELYEDKTYFQTDSLIDWKIKYVNCSGYYLIIGNFYYSKGLLFVTYKSDIATIILQRNLYLRKTF